MAWRERLKPCAHSLMEFLVNLWATISNCWCLSKFIWVTVSGLGASIGQLDDVAEKVSVKFKTENNLQKRFAKCGIDR